MIPQSVEVSGAFVMLSQEYGSLPGTFVPGMMGPWSHVLSDLLSSGNDGTLASQ